MCTLNSALRVSDLPLALVFTGSGALGVAAGVGGAWLCDALPPRYEITHLVTGARRQRRNVGVVILVVAAALWLAHLVALSPETAAGRAGVYFGANLLLVAAVIAAAAIDLEHMILPNELTLGGAVFALGTSYFRLVGLGGALIGAAVGLALTYLPFLIYKQLRGRSGMGLGDAKLALLAGLWLGPWGVAWVVFAGSLQAALFAGGARLIGHPITIPASVQAEIAELREKAASGDVEAREMLADDPMAADVAGDSFATTRLPMGPALVLSCLEFLVFRSRIMALLNALLSTA